MVLGRTPGARKRLPLLLPLGAAVDSLWSKRVIGAFDQWAASYSKTAKAKIEARGYSYHQLGKLVWDCLGRPEHGTVVDLGCGPGLVGECLPLAEGKVSLIGVDISPNMVAQIPAGVYQALIEASAESLPISTNTAVGVYSTFMLHSLRDRQRGLAEIRRILHPGGIGVIVDLFPASKGIPLWSPLARHLHSIRYEKAALSNYVTLQQLTKEVVESGFDVLRIVQLGRPKSYIHGLVAFRLPNALPSENTLQE